jgi:hypothetical protein
MTTGQYFTASMVRRLKGAPLAIYCLLKLSGKPESAEYLEMYGGYSDKVIQKGLRFLQEEGYITRNGRYSWQLSTYASQLPLMAQTELELPAGETEACDPTIDALTGDKLIADEDPESDVEVSRESENLRLGISDSLARSLNLVNTEESLDSRKDILASDPENFRLLFEALDEWGIREPARSIIARMPGMTLERIDYHCTTCEHSGQAIYRIKNNWPVKNQWNDPYA